MVNNPALANGFFGIDRPRRLLYWRRLLQVSEGATNPFTAVVQGNFREENPFHGM
jgi:hypothetical protein